MVEQLTILGPIPPIVAFTQATTGPKFYYWFWWRCRVLVFLVQSHAPPIFCTTAFQSFYQCKINLLLVMIILILIVIKCRIILSRFSESLLNRSGINYWVKRSWKGTFSSSVSDFVVYPTPCKRRVKGLAQKYFLLSSMDSMTFSSLEQTIALMFNIYTFRLKRSADYRFGNFNTGLITS